MRQYKSSILSGHYFHELIPFQLKLSKSLTELHQCRMSRSEDAVKLLESGPTAKESAENISHHLQADETSCKTAHFKSTLLDISLKCNAQPRTHKKVISVRVQLQHRDNFQ